MYLRKRMRTNKTSLPALLVGSLALGAVSMTANVGACPSEPYIGGMCAFAGNFAPRNWAYANGQLLPISQNTALFSLLGTYFGGDGRTTFALPDLQSRAIVGVGQGPGLSNYSIGQKSGSEFIPLTVSQIPSHNHSATTRLDLLVEPADVSATTSLNAQNTPGTSTTPSGNMLAQNTASNVYSASAPIVSMYADAIEATASGNVNATASTNLQNTGGSQSHENRMPYLAINWIVAMQGTYPSRN